MTHIPGPSALAALLARLRSLGSGAFARLRSLARGLFRRGDVEAEMTEEFHHHIEMRTEDLLREGLPPEEAARRARIEFGHVETHREAARASRGLRAFDRIRFSWLDVKLGLRMLAKYPGLSVISVVGMAVAIAIASGAFAVIETMMDATLPLPDGDRVVSIQNNTREPGNPDRRALHDFVVWREELSSVRDLAAFTMERRNLVTADGRVALVPVARTTASAFRVASVPPLLGRHLLAADERAGAPPVVVIAYEEWRRRFDGDPEIVGRTVRLGGTEHTVVGVMPEGFRFPLYHRYWVPLRLDPTAYPRGEGPFIMVAGRLADGATLESAQAELATIGARLAVEFPDTHEDLRPQVLPYTHAFMDVDSPAIAWALRGAQILVALLLVVVAVNVAVLIYARTATRLGEIAVRSALGASRRRIVTQLFAEAFVLSLVAAAVGLTIAGVGLGTAEALFLRQPDVTLPFWLGVGVSAELAVYVAGLAVLGGVIVGVFPALRATGRSLGVGLQAIGSGGSRMRLGRMWTAMIVSQVAIAVAVLPDAVNLAGDSVRAGTAEPGYPAAEFLRARLSIEREEAPSSAEADAYERDLLARFVDGTAELLRRLEAEPAVAGVTFAASFPGDEPVGRIEVEGTGTQHWVWTNRVDVHLFDVFDVPVLAGRGFEEADAGAGSNVVIVDREFAEHVLGGGDVVGRRVRRVRRRGRTAHEDVETGPWLEIVGVVADFTTSSNLSDADPKLYEPVALADVPTPLLAVRTRGTAPDAFARRIRGIAAAVDPGLQLRDLQSAADAVRDSQQVLLLIALGVVAVCGSVLLLSAAGIYAMMSFTVARRRREIGIRSALGADPGRLLRAIFARAAAQLAAGVLCGLLLKAAIDQVDGSSLGRHDVVPLLTVVALMTVIGALATLGPARRGLAVQPTEALREE